MPYTLDFCLFVQLVHDSHIIALRSRRAAPHGFRYLTEREASRTIAYDAIPAVCRFQTLCASHLLRFLRCGRGDRREMAFSAFWAYVFFRLRLFHKLFVSASEFLQALESLLAQTGKASHVLPAGFC